MNREKIGPARGRSRRVVTGTRFLTRLEMGALSKERETALIEKATSFGDGSGPNIEMAHTVGKLFYYVEGQVDEAWQTTSVMGLVVLVLQPAPMTAAIAAAKSKKKGSKAHSAQHSMWIRIVDFGTGNVEVCRSRRFFARRRRPPDAAAARAPSPSLAGRV